MSQSSNFRVLTAACSRAGADSPHSISRYRMSLDLMRYRELFSIAECCFGAQSWRQDRKRAGGIIIRPGASLASLPPATYDYGPWSASVIEIFVAPSVPVFSMRPRWLTASMARNIRPDHGRPKNANPDFHPPLPPGAGHAPSMQSRPGAAAGCGIRSDRQPLRIV